MSVFEKIPQIVSFGKQDWFLTIAAYFIEPWEIDVAISSVSLYLFLPGNFTGFWTQVMLWPLYSALKEANLSVVWTTWKELASQ